jgi:hypothetical protein
MWVDQSTPGPHLGLLDLCLTSQYLLARDCILQPATMRIVHYFRRIQTR